MNNEWFKTTYMGVWVGEPEFDSWQEHMEYYKTKLIEKYEGVASTPENWARMRHEANQMNENLLALYGTRGYLDPTTILK